MVYSDGLRMIMSNTTENTTTPHLLVVDDSIDNLTLMSFYLKSLRAELETASNGKDAVERCKQIKFDLILMDIQMPEMNGYEATQLIRQCSCNMQTPILALTAHSDQENIDRAISAGCNEHISKPIQQLELLDKIHSYLSHPRD